MQDGRWVVQGWGATRLLPGSSSESHDVEWLTVLRAGRAFRQATRVLPRPDWLADRSSWWTSADDAAWCEQSMDVIAPLEPLVARLRHTVPLDPLPCHRATTRRGTGSHHDTMVNG